MFLTPLVCRWSAPFLMRRHALIACALSSVHGSIRVVSGDDWSASLLRVGELLTSVPLQNRDRCEGVLRGLNRPGFAQAWQDWFLYRNFFAGQRHGVYLDIGTNDPIRISNTFFFDTCLHWRGVCFEPQELYHERIRANRSCTLVPNCVLGRAANVSASVKGGGGFSVRESSGPSAMHMHCVGILETLRELNMHKPIDLLSIDIEGNEPSVLRCMPFDELGIRVVVIETAHVSSLRDVDAFFHNHGYANVATLLNTDAIWLDNIYVRLQHPLVRPSPVAACTPEDHFFTNCAGGGQFAAWPRLGRRAVADPRWGACEQ